MGVLTLLTVLAVLVAMLTLPTSSCGRYWRTSYEMVSGLVWTMVVDEFVRIAEVVGVEGRDSVVCLTKREECVVVGWGSTLMIGN